MSTGPECVQALGERLFHPVRRGDADRGNAVGSRDGREIGIVFAAGRGMRFPVLALELRDDIERVIVQHDDFDVEIHLGDGGKLLNVHLQAAVADEAQDLRVGMGDLRPDGRGQIIAHGSVTRRGQKAALRVVEAEMARDPDLMLADAGGDDQWFRRM